MASDDKHPSNAPRFDLSVERERLLELRLPPRQRAAAQSRTAFFRLSRAQCSVSSFEALSELYEFAVRQPGRSIAVSFQELNYYDADLPAAISIVQNTLRKEHGVYLGFVHLNAAVRKGLQEVGLFGPVSERASSTVAPLKLFDKDQSIEFAEFTHEHIATKGLPVMSEVVANRVFEGIDELFQNFEIHSGSRHGAYACGHLDPDQGTLRFTLADHGVGIPTVVNRAGHDLKPPMAIDWAMSARNTTRSGDVPGGLGLKILREFVTLNGGGLAIVSNDGYWRQVGGEVEMFTLKRNFPGTVVTVTVNTQDESQYVMEDEIDPAGVF